MSAATKILLAVQRVLKFTATSFQCRPSNPYCYAKYSQSSRTQASPWLHQHVHQQQRRCMGIWAKVYPKRIRVITCDVTGTLVSFRGSLEQHYLGSAQKCGIDFVGTTECLPIDQAFHRAYKEVSHLYPCFGGSTISAKEWWKLCVSRSFAYAGAAMDTVQQDAVFQRIYSIFGSQACYEKFDDALPFLIWARRNNITCGVLSNADERYGDAILPMLGLTHDELQIQCFSKDFGLEKPDTRFYLACLQQAENFLISSRGGGSSGGSGPGDANHGSLEDDPLLPSQVLHIGNDFAKDFEGARRAGMHAVLLSRYAETERASEWKRRGALVCEDLLDVVELLGRCNCQLG
jgi:putative hydrolase of the HAD superfamily